MRVHWVLWLIALVFAPPVIAGTVSAGGANGFIGWSVTTLLVGFLWFGDAQAARKRHAQVRQRDAEAAAKQHEQEIHDFLDSDVQPIDTPGITLKSGERCYFASPVLQVQNVKHTTRVGGYGGPSFRVARGVYVRTGAFASRAISGTSPEVTDRGTVYLTGQRVLFVGSDGAKEYRYANITAYETFADGFRFDVSNRKPVFYLTEQPSLLGVAFERIRQGLLTGRRSIVGIQSGRDTTAGLVRDDTEQLPPGTP